MQSKKSAVPGAEGMTLQGKVIACKAAQALQLP